MSLLRLTGETWLDLTVNLVPIGILAVFEILFFVVNPWGWDPLVVAVTHFLTLFPLVLLALLTWMSGATIQQAEGTPLQ